MCEAMVVSRTQSNDLLKAFQDWSQHVQNFPNRIRYNIELEEQGNKAGPFPVFVVRKQPDWQIHP